MSQFGSRSTRPSTSPVTTASTTQFIPRPIGAASANNPAASANLDSAAHAKAIQLATATLETCASASVGNPTVALAAVHLVTTLCYQSMQWTPSTPRDASCDRIFFSDTVYSPLLYAMCADLGVSALIDGGWRALTKSDLDLFGSSEGSLPTTPAPATVALMAHQTGALGAGLSTAVGDALAARIDALPRRAFCVISDAELREGQLWQALTHIVEERLTSVVPVFVLTPLASTDRAASVDSPEALARRLTALGFHAATIDGHAPAQIREAVETITTKARTNQPTAIIARCTKGWGAKSLQGGAWNGHIPTGDRLKVALEELRSARVGLTSSFGTDIAAPSARAKTVATPVTSMHAALDAVPDFARAMREADMLAVYQSGRLAPRRALSLAMRALGRAHTGVMLLECDARTNAVSELFAADRALSSRFIEFRGAQSHMIGAACAMSSLGRPIFAASSARGFVRAHEAIEVAAQSGVSLTLVATNAGLGAANEGAASTSLSDVTWMRALTSARDAVGNPTAYLLQPCDAFAAYALTLAAADHDGLSMLRLPAGEQEFLYNGETIFNLGRFEVLVEGTDLLIVTAGAMVHEVNRALDDLDKAGIDATVVDLYSIPFDEDALLDLANRNDGRILVIEDNFGGAIAGAVAQACASAGDAFTIESMCVQSAPTSARNFAQALTATKLSATDIVDRAKRMMGVKKS